MEYGAIHGIAAIVLQGSNHAVFRFWGMGLVHSRDPGHDGRLVRILAHAPSSLVSVSTFKGRL